MSEYVNYSGGPGSIGALKPLAALSHAPTIGSNNPRRNIGNVTSRAYPVQPLQGMGSGVFQNGDGVFDGSCGCGCGGAMGTEESGRGLPSWAVPMGLLVLIGGGVIWLKRSKAKDEQAEALARYYY